MTEHIIAPPDEVQQLRKSYKEEDVEIHVTVHTDKQVNIGGKKTPRQLLNYIEENFDEWSEERRGGETEKEEMSDGEICGYELVVDEFETPEDETIEYKVGVNVSEKAMDESEIEILEEEARHAVVEQIREKIEEEYYETM